MGHAFFGLLLGTAIGGIGQTTVNSVELLSIYNPEQKGWDDYQSSPSPHSMLVS